MVNVAKNIHPTACVTGCKVDDTTPPPTPQVRQAICGAKLFGPEANFAPNYTPAPQPATRDPAYFELGNWEPGTKIQIINKSNDPTASFDDKKAVVTLSPTGRDVDNRIAAVWMTQEQMDKINLDAGDSLWLRVIDEDGNASATVKTRLQGSSYGEMGRVVDEGAWHAASRVRLLDGESDWKSNMVLRHIADVKAPEVKAFESKAKLSKGEGGDLTLLGDGLLEEGAQVRVMSGATGDVFHGSVDAEQGLKVALGSGIKDGDTLYVTVSDENGVAAGKFELRYGAKCKDGRAPSKGILGAHLASIIKPG